MVGIHRLRPGKRSVQARQYAYLERSASRSVTPTESNTTQMKRLLFAMLLLLAMAQPARSQMVAVQTNALDYVALGTLNLQAQVSFAQNYSAFLEGRWNPWTFGQGEDATRLGYRKASVGVRYWPWYVYSGLWVAASFQLSELDRINFMNMDKLEAHGGSGAGLSLGYSFMILPFLNLDFGAGLCYTRYSSYVTNGVPSSNGSLSVFQPDFLSASIVYVFK